MLLSIILLNIEYEKKLDSYSMRYNYLTIKLKIKNY